MQYDTTADRLGADWELSGRDHSVTVDRDVEIPVAGGDVTLVADVFRPETDEPVPTIIGAHPYPNEYQTAQIKPKSIGPQMAWIEAGDPYYFARRGYAHVVMSLRGTGKSTGEFRFCDTREAQDVVDAMDWLAEQDWCTGAFGMFGVSYFSMIQKKIATLEPDRLVALFAPWGLTDFYRDWLYHGGIFFHEFATEWLTHVDNPRAWGWSKHNLSEDEYERRIAAALNDPEIFAQETLAAALQNPDDPANRWIVDVVINNRFDEFFEERRLSFENTNTPAYLGSGWGSYGLHTGGDFRTFRKWKGPKRMLVGPPLYLDRPLYQLQPEAVRWFDHWLKGVDNGIMDEHPVKLFVDGSGEWKDTEDWPVPDTTWQRFYLHDENLLFERDHWPNEGYTTYEDGPYRHEAVDFISPKLVENTEVAGPIRLNLFASSTAEEALFFVELFDVGPDGDETELSRGWLRGSMRAVDPDRSTPWRAYHPFDERVPLKPGEVYEFNINLRPVGHLFKAGHKIGVRVSSSDAGSGWAAATAGEANPSWSQAVSSGHLYRQSVSRVTLYHDEDHPSNILLPVTRGNRMGTFYSGGEPTPQFGELPYRYVEMDKSVDD